MIVHLIVIRHPEPSEDTYWTTEAWDENTIDENPQGYEEALKKAQASNGADHVRVLKVQLPEGALAKPFEVPVVKGEVVE